MRKSSEDQLSKHLYIHECSCKLVHLLRNKSYNTMNLFIYMLKANEACLHSPTSILVQK